MRSSLDCVPCLLRQGLNATRMASDDPEVHSEIVRDLLRLMTKIDLDESPPRLAQRIHRHLRDTIGNEDPYRESKDRHNLIARHMLPELRALIESASDPLDKALCVAIAGNAIDMGPRADATESDIREGIDVALRQPLGGDHAAFRQTVETADSIVYLADNAGEIVFDRLLIEYLGPDRVTVVVRGAPVINDATLVDARTTGLTDIVEVIDNGSDAPGTILADCSEELRHRFAEADLVIAKGQGNYESLSEEQREIFFLFKVKCDVIADHVGFPVGTHVLKRSFEPS